MPTYEMTVLFKMLPKQELFTAVKRTATGILSQGGVLRKLDGLGVDVKLPYKHTAHGKSSRHASCFLFTFDSPTNLVKELETKHKFDIDIIKTTVFLTNLPMQDECTLEEELKPAPYREPVIKAMQKLERKRKPKFRLNTGLDYNPLP